MHTYLKVAAVFAMWAATIASGSTIASAKEQCACVLPPAKLGQPVGTFTSTGPDVLVVHDGQASRAEANLSVAVGEQIMTGPGSTASVSLGETCNLALTPNSTLTVIPTATNICVAIKRPKIVAISGGADNQLAIGLGGLGVAAGIAILVSRGGGDDDCDDCSVSKQ